jgi:hypothetical protein
MKELICVSAMAIAMSACSAHNPFIVANTTDVKPAAAQQFAPHTGPVLIVEGPLPPTVEFVLVADIEIGKVWYGGSDKILQEMADRARALGADAVIEAKTWHQPSGYSWAAPHGHGQAVKILNPDQIRDLPTLGTMR